MRFKFKLMMMCKKLSSGFKRGRDSKDRTLQYLRHSDGSGQDGFGWMSTIWVFETNMVILYNFSYIFNHVNDFLSLPKTKSGNLKILQNAN